MVDYRTLFNPADIHPRYTSQWQLAEAPGDGVVDWRTHLPQLTVLEASADMVLDECEAFIARAGASWFGWPQKELWPKPTDDWAVIPLLGFNFHIPAFQRQIPETWKLLKSIEGLRTAIFSRVGPHTRVAPHRGPIALATNIIRCHFTVRGPDNSGVWVNGRWVPGKPGELFAFDDTMIHSGVNDSDEDKIVLLIDMDRPAALREPSWPVLPFPTELPQGWEKVAQLVPYTTAP